MKRKATLKHTGAFWAFVAPCIILFGVFFLLPLVLSIAFSFTNYDGWKTMDFVALDNYIELFTDSRFYVSLGRTLLYTICALPFRVIVPLLVAVLLMFFAIWAISVIVRAVRSAMGHPFVMVNGLITGTRIAPSPRADHERTPWRERLAKKRAAAAAKHGEHAQGADGSKGPAEERER